MKRKTLILSTLGAFVIGGIAFVTLPAIADGDDDKNGWFKNCPRGGYSQMMQGHHRGGGMGMMGGKRFMQGKDINLQLTTERVKDIMEGRLAWRGNDNIKVGDVTTDKDGQIIAQLVTKDNSLIETFMVDPKTGAHSPMR